MTTSKTTSKERGFTIIEVLIVLAIAGLILLIVFLAVPALQRNSRNTQYKNDAASLLAAATEYVNNNNGTLPADSSGNGSGSTNADAIVNLTNVKSITSLDITTGTGSVTLSNFDTAYLVKGVKCNARDSGNEAIFTTSGSSTRALTMIYAVENSKGEPVAQCTES